VRWITRGQVIAPSVVGEDAGRSSTSLMSGVEPLPLVFLEKKSGGRRRC